MFRLPNPDRPITTFVLTLMITLAFLNLHPAKPQEHGNQNKTNFSPEAQSLLDMLQSRDTTIKQILGPENDDSYTRERRDRLIKEINKIIDFETMSRAVLDETWNTLTADQQADFLNNFADLVRKSSLRKLDIYRAKVEYKSVIVNGDQAVVYTQATYHDTRSQVVYKLHRGGKEWKVIDFLIDDVSTVTSYQTSFRNIMRKYGFNGLLDRIRKKIMSLDAAKDEKL